MALVSTMRVACLGLPGLFFCLVVTWLPAVVLCAAGGVCCRWCCLWCCSCCCRCIMSIAADGAAAGAASGDVGGAAGGACLTAAR